MTDWRDIFKRYLRIVSEAEGVSFLRSRDWTAEEWAAILEAENEAWGDG